MSKAEPQPRPKPGDTLYWSSPVAWEALPVTVGKCGRKWAEITRSAPSWSGVVACRMDLDTLTVENSSVRCYRSEAEWQADHDRIVAEKETNRVWKKFTDKVSKTFWIGRPENANADAIRQAAALLGIALDENP